MWPMFLADALSKGIQDTTAGAVTGLKEGQKAQQTEEQMSQARAEEARRAQMFPLDYQAKQQENEFKSQMNPLTIKGAQTDVTLGQETLPSKVEAAKLAPDEIRSKIDQARAQAAHLTELSKQAGVETSWLGARYKAQIDHLNKQVEVWSQNLLDDQYAQKMKVEAVNALSTLVSNGQFKTGSVKELMNNPELFNVLGKYGPWLKDNPLVDVYLKFLGAMGQQDKVDVFGHMLKMDDQALQEGQIDETRFFGAPMQGQPPSNPEARQWIRAHARASVLKRFTGEAPPVLPVPDSMRAKLESMYSNMLAPDRRPFYQWWGKPELNKAFLDKTIEYLQQGYSYEDAPVKAAKDIVNPQAPSAADTTSGGGYSTPSYDVQILPNGNRKIVPKALSPK